jgi:Tol biopolymer transport system component
MGRQLPLAITLRRKAKKTTSACLPLGRGKLRASPGSEGFFAPRWSPDGRCLVALTEDNSTLMLYDTQAQTWKKLLKRPELIGYITWSRDSTSLYFDTIVTQQPAFTSCLCATPNLTALLI